MTQCLDTHSKRQRSESYFVLRVHRTSQHFPSRNKFIWRRRMAARNGELSIESKSRAMRMRGAWDSGRTNRQFCCRFGEIERERAEWKSLLLRKTMKKKKKKDKIDKNRGTQSARRERPSAAHMCVCVLCASNRSLMGVYY